MNKKNWTMTFEVETSNPVWYFYEYNKLYREGKFDELKKKYYDKDSSELKSFKATIKFDCFDKSYALFEDVNIPKRYYIVYLTDLKDFIHLLNNGEITGIFKYVNKNGNKGIKLDSYGIR